MAQALSGQFDSNAEAEAWRDYRAAVMAMKKSPTQENARKAVLNWKRYFDEVMRGVDGQ